MKNAKKQYHILLSTTLMLSLICVSPAVWAGNFSKKPNFIKGNIIEMYYDGINDDLASAGLGLAGLQGAVPAIDPVNPTTAEIRRLAIYNNYRALVDFTSSGGFGRLYGPNIKEDGTAGQGLISGYELLAYAGRNNVAMMVQIPDSFNPDEPCIVAAPSSGSRGVYGAIGTAGDWGLKKGCAVAYTDAGKGVGAHNLQNNQVNLIDGKRVDANIAGDDAHFIAPLSDQRRQAFNQRYPGRFAFKHAHSKKNPEKNWGKNVLRSIEFAFYALNDKYRNISHNGYKKPRITPRNTIVIASSVSNGGGASVRAAEQDYRGLIDGVAVSEPNVNPRFDRRFSIVQGDNAPVFNHSRSLYDYTTLINIYQSCANLAAENSLAPLNFAPSADACTSLREQNLLQTDNVAEQAEEAQRIINDYGILTEQNVLQPSHWFINVPQGIAVTYANAYGRFGVNRNLCNYSFAAVDTNSMPTTMVPELESILFATANGIPPTGGVQLINNVAQGGAQENRISVSAISGRADQNLEGALCLRALSTGFDINGTNPFNRRVLHDYWRVKLGIRQVLANGNLHRKPTIIVTGRSDAILAPNHTSRAYVGLNKMVEGSRSNVRYYEVTNAQHLDVLNSLAGFNDKFIPLHHYFLKGMDLMYNHLNDGAELPASQVVRSSPRGIDSMGNVPDLDEATHLPAISSEPSSTQQISFVNRQLLIPE